MNDDEIVAALRRVSLGSSPVRVAESLRDLLGGQLTQGALVTYFKRAFPAIPLRTLLDAGAWSRLTNGGVTDEQFNELLKAWIPSEGK